MNTEATQKIISATVQKLSNKARKLFPIEKIEKLIAEHQRQYPGNWNGFDASERAEEMARIANAAASSDEAHVSRAILFYA